MIQNFALAVGRRDRKMGIFLDGAHARNNRCTPIEQLNDLLIGVVDLFSAFSKPRFDGRRRGH